ncbi:F-box-like domain superfamily [Arabidopsis thaliana x Arabidopsis arenosa]|uniref:F-box-like domain superfamily n=1 Tax=Arabidopsis thaliana x Arabidopsis arenosa TaxID=1240361 RepID=A0A8T1XIS0_9BRAS|nr:F-box-like domain superfamily [Arabidopsis thaliana x Arabidopsis arenosa]
MDMISQLPDELLLRILSLLPTAKDVVATMVWSKRWQFLWMFVPRLVYDDSYQIIENGSFWTFVDRSLLVHKAPVLETLHFKLGKICGSGDIPVWIRAADKCCVRELIMEINTPSSNETPVTLPRSLITCCKMLVTLKLRNAVLVDDVSSPISFPSLKKLSLISMKYLGGDDFLNRLISSCLILEDLVVEQILNDNVAILIVRVPCLKSLVLHQKQKKAVKGKANGFVIDTPALECLEIAYFSRGFHIVENDMPNIVKANVHIYHRQTAKLLGSITLAKHLYLCVPTSKNAYPVGSIFCCLVRLEICTCHTDWLNLLMCILSDSPKLQSLILDRYHKLRPSEPRPCWNEPSSVPECVLSSLKTLEWVKYEGTEEEKEVAAFILRSARCLKKATIISPKSLNSHKKLEMLKELSLMPRCSPCQLQFD